MSQESMEELVGLVNRMKGIVDSDPSVTVRINSAVSLLEAVIREQMEISILRIYRGSKNLTASNIAE